ncbi:TPA: transcription antiterminator [Listeria monocytogenes]
MLEKRMIDLLSMLSENEYISARKLALSLGISSKTILNDIKMINPIIVSTGSIIEVKPKQGCKLIIKDKIKYNELINQSKKKSSENIPNTSQERVRYLIKLFLKDNDWIKVSTLIERLFISNSSLSKDLKKVRKYLKKFNIDLESKPNYGMRAFGNEFNFRLCLVSIISEQEINIENSEHSTQKLLNEIKLITNEIFLKKSIEMNDISYETLIFHIYTAIERNKKGYHIELTEVQLIEFIEKKEYILAKEIINRIDSKLGLSLKESETEVAYLTIHLEAKRIINSDSENTVVTEETNNIVSLMLREVKEKHYIDFFEDFDLRMMLALHLVPFKVRMEYNLILKNPLLKEIKIQYPYAYDLAVASSTVLNRYYNKTISEEEIGYFALHFNLGLERRKKIIEKKNLLIVCGTGRGTAQLLLYQFQENFGKYLNYIDSCSVFDLDNKDFAKIDYVVTTVPLKEGIPVPILEIKTLMGESDIYNINRFLKKETINSKSILNYFSENLFLVDDIEALTKEEVIYQMVNKIKDVKKSIPDNFYESVLIRENQAPTEMGNLVAMPHPSVAISDETFVCVGILKKPIIWKNKKVQFVYMTSIESNIDRDLSNFYKVTSKFLINSTYVDTVIKQKDFELMLNILARIEENLV